MRRSDWSRRVAGIAPTIAGAELARSLLAGLARSLPAELAAVGDGLSWAFGAGPWIRLMLRGHGTMVVPPSMSG